MFIHVTEVADPAPSFSIQIPDTQEPETVELNIGTRQAQA